MMNENFKKMIYDSFISSIKEKNSNRSNERLKILHGYLANEIQKKVSDEFVILSLNEKENSKEYKFKGIFFDKNTDIAILDSNGNLKSLIAIKFIISNYEQNWKNYFEQMISESLNVKFTNDKINIYQIIIIRDNLPYFTKEKSKISKIETPFKNSDSKQKKYETFFNYNNSQYNDGACLMLVDFNEKNINNKYVNKKINFDYNSYYKELKEYTDLEKIEILYPLEVSGENSIFEINDLILKIEKDLNK